jgi:hypothetical protein
MTKNILVIGANDLEHFSISTDTGTLTLGEGSGQLKFVLRGLRVKGIRFEVEADNPVLAADEENPYCDADDRPLPTCEDVLLGPVQLRLEPYADNTPATATAAAEPAAAPVDDLFASIGTAPVVESVQRFKIKVVDGADKGQAFSLPATGSIIIGSSAKSAGIVLHDLYVKRAHCRLDVQPEGILVTHLEGDNGTLINGQRISKPQLLALEQKLRVGNSHLVLEIDTAPPKSDDGEFAKPEEEATWPEEVQHTRVLQAHAAPTAPEPPRIPWPPKEGQVVGHFKLGPQLGKGYAGVSFRAEDTKTNTTVTLKVLVPDFPANNDELAQLARALKATPGLHHAHLVALHGAGKSGPYCWIAQDYVEGESIDQPIERLREGGKPSWIRAVRVAIHLGRVLRYLHHHKFIHGNITPHNVFIHAGDKQTKLSDLMLKQALQGSKVQEAYEEKKSLAELPYLAPDQVEADAVANELTDLYAVGAVTYALLTGRPPFKGSDHDALLEQVLHTPARKPSYYQHDIPKAVDAAVLKLLAKDPAERYQSADDLLADLESFAEKEEIKL